MNLKQARLSVGYFFMALFALFIGLYPLRFIGLSYDDSLLGNKSSSLLDSLPYMVAFYSHIYLGGLALISGFSQFFSTLRKKYLGFHKVLGKVYVISVLLSGVSGLSIAFFAEGGFVAATGFAALAILWLFTTIKAYITIKNGDIENHRRWMIRSYALCFAAVTLRIYMPLFLGVLGMDFIPAYKLIAWLSWAPNLLVTEVTINRKQSLPSSSDV